AHGAPGAGAALQDGEGAAVTGLVLALAALFLVLGFVIRAAGTAVTRVPRADALRDEAEGVRGAGPVAALLEERDAIVSAVGMVASALLIVSSVLAAAALASGRPLGMAMVVAVLVGAVALIVGDIVPRALGRHFPHRLAYGFSDFLMVAVSLGGWAYDLLPEPEVRPEQPEEPAQDEDEEQEREMIDSVLEFGDTVVREVMTPRPDMVTVPVTASIEEVIEISTSDGFSRLPVVSNGDVVGQVIVKDLLPMLSGGERPRSVAEVMRPVVFVPETKQIAALLSEMKENHNHQMVVIDEFGDVTGLVTIEDLLEELVGEIADETDTEELLIIGHELGWEVDARLPVDDLVAATGVPLPDEEWDTVAGLVLGLAERVPEPGEVFTYEDLEIEVTRMQGRRVAAVSVRRARAEEAG
ncbi:MAG: hemolysin family protein, partial [Acidimicrobiia bacterium]